MLKNKAYFNGSNTTPMTWRNWNVSPHLENISVESARNRIIEISSIWNSRRGRWDMVADR